MRPASGAITLGVAAALTFALRTMPASANILQDFEREATDPLGVVRGSDNLRQTALEVLAQIQPLMDRGDAIAQQRLDQIHQIIMSTISGGMAAEDKAVGDLKALQFTLMDDIDRLFYKVECAEAKASSQFVGTLDKTVDNLAAAHPTVKVLGIPIATVQFRKLAETAPNTVYFATRDSVEADLEHKVTDETNAYVIKSAYANLENFAKSTRCFYLGQGDEITFLREENRLEVIQQYWNTAVTLHP